jgi:hypothetical protein
VLLNVAALEIVVEVDPLLLIVTLTLAPKIVPEIVDPPLVPLEVIVNVFADPEFVIVPLVKV